MDKNDLISRAYVLAEYDRQHQGPPGGARKIMEEAPAVDAIPMWWITEKFLDVLNKDKELSKAVWVVRKAWQKEQEGERRNGDAQCP